MARRGSKRRTYSATEPLFARVALQFSGTPVACRTQVPEALFSSPRKRARMWRARKVDHAQDLPRKALAGAEDIPNPLPEASNDPQVAEALTDEQLEVLTAPQAEAVTFTKPPGELVTFDPPEPQAAPPAANRRRAPR